MRLVRSGRVRAGVYHPRLSWPGAGAVAHPATAISTLISLLPARSLLTEVHTLDAFSRVFHSHS
jgi:hypothetical protein